MIKHPFKNNTEEILNCPYCEQKTINQLTLIGEAEQHEDKISGFFLASCKNCGKSSMYLETDERAFDHIAVGYAGPNIHPQYSLAKNLVERKMIYPRWTADEDISFPSKNMPDDVKSVYKEAVSVYDASPRAAGILIRVALEKYLKKYVYKKGNATLNNIIGHLAKMQSPYIVHIYDLIRIKGNGQAHSQDNDSVNLKTLNDNDTKKDVKSLFKFLNLLCNQTAVFDESENLYRQLPEQKLRQIENRDKNLENKKS